jgi:prepilin-type processing-associated H-X9-DG protein
MAAILADGASLDSGELWFVDADLAAEAITVIPKTVITKSGTTVALSAAWSTAIGQGNPAWNTYTPTSRSLAGSTNTTFAWSRGLTIAGAWPAAGAGATDSIWGIEGGHICYGDGHVAWVKETVTTGSDYFQKTTDGSASASYKDAIPATAALCTLD